MRTHRAIGVVALVFVLALVVGVEMVAQPQRYFAAWRPGVYLNAKLAIVLLCGVGVVAGAAFMQISWSRAFVGILPGLTLLATAWQLRDGAAVGALVLVGFGVLVAVFGMMSGARRSQLWFVFAVLAGVFARELVFAQFPLDNTGGDMVPLLQKASARLLSGQSPYAVYSMPWQLPLTYLPGSFLPCVPFVAFGVDLRWAFVMAHVLAALVLVWPFWLQHSVLSQQPMLAVWLVYFLAPGTLHFDVLSNSAFAWAALLAMVVAVTHWPQHFGWFVGAALVTTPLALPVAAVVIACRRWSWVPLRRLLGQLSLVLGVLLLPWVLWEPGSFFFGVFTWFNDLQGFPAQKWEAGRTWARFLGFAGLFWSWGLPQLLRVIQAIGIAGAMVLAWVLALRGPRIAAPLAMVTLAWFVVWNPVVWPYLPHGILPMLALCAQARD